MNFYNIRNNELLSISGIIVLILVFFLVGRAIDFDVINQYIKNAGMWAPFLFIIAKASTVFFAPISGSPLYILVGTVFGLTEGIFYSFLGDLLGFSLIFYASRKYGLNLIKKILGDREEKVMEIVHNNTKDVKSFLKAVALFFWFPEMIIAAAGLSKLKYFKIMPIFMAIYSFIASLFIIISALILNV